MAEPQSPGGESPSPPEDTLEALARFLQGTNLPITRTRGKEAQAIGPKGESIEPFKVASVESGTPPGFSGLPLDIAKGKLAETLKTKNIAGCVGLDRFPGLRPLLFVDLDSLPDKDHFKSFNPPQTFTVRSGRKDGDGFHCWYYMPPNCPKPKIEFIGGAIKLSTKGYGLLPGSWHAKGERFYTVAIDAPTVEFPQEIYDAIVSEGNQRHRKAKEQYGRGDKIPKGQRDDMLVSYIGYLHASGFPQSTVQAAIFDLLEDHVEWSDNPGGQMPQSEYGKWTQKIARFFQDWKEVEELDPFLVKSFSFPDVHPPARQPGLAEPEMAQHFVTAYGRYFRYFVEADRWIVFQDGLGRWTHINGSLTARETAKKLIRSVKKTYADPLPEGDEYKESVLKWHANKAWRSYRDNVLYFAEEELPINTDKLDRDPFVISFANGIFDLKTLTFREGQPDDYITVGSPVDYVPGAHSDLWHKVLHDSLQSEEEIRSLQCLAGYLLTGLTREETSWWFHGAGRNGKDTIVGAFQTVLGPELAVSMNFSSLAAKRYENGSGPSSDLARLRGKRLVTVSEIKSTVAIDDERLKRLVGGNRITARSMRENEIEFDPSHKFIFTVNDKPLINVTDVAIRERIILVPFLNSFTRENGTLIEGLKEQLHTEPEHLKAVAAWMVEGYKQYAETGLYIAPSFKAATQEFLDEANPARDFIETCLELGPSYTTTGKEMDAAYRDYIFETDVLRLPADVFSRALQAAGLQRKRSKQGTAWLGVQVKGAEA